MILYFIVTQMDYKQETLKLLTRFPKLKLWEMIKLNRYFLEYARGIAEANDIDTIKEYRWTSKLIEKYKIKWYECFWNVWTLLDMYDQIAKTQIQYSDWETMLAKIVSSEELAEFDCLIKLLQKK